MKEIVKVSSYIIMLMVIILIITVIATELITKPVLNNFISSHENELIYPERFNLPKDAKRLNPFFMPNNIKADNQLQENISPIYDLEFRQKQFFYRLIINFDWKGIQIYET